MKTVATHGAENQELAGMPQCGNDLGRLRSSLLSQKEVLKRGDGFW
jgi:hypothetical protein